MSSACPAGLAGRGQGRGPGLVTSGPLSAALAWFSRPAAAEGDEHQGAGAGAAEDAADEAEAEIIQLLKRAKVRQLGERVGFVDEVWWPCCYAFLPSVYQSVHNGSDGIIAQNCVGH